MMFSTPNRSLLIGALAAVALLAIGASSVAAQDTQECEALFVQSARNVTLDDKKLTLTGVSPMVTFFCDRPQRMAGHISMDEFLQSWEHGKESFSDDPPNAVISVLDGMETDDVVIELMDKPTVTGDTITYEIRAIQGVPAIKNGAGSLFIDIIGRPLTPMSVAGVSRRTTRRAIRRCAVGVTCY